MAQVINEETQLLKGKNPFEIRPCYVDENFASVYSIALVQKLKEIQVGEESKTEITFETRPVIFRAERKYNEQTHKHNINVSIQEVEQGKQIIWQDETANVFEVTGTYTKSNTMPRSKALFDYVENKPKMKIGTGYGLIQEGLKYLMNKVVLVGEGDYEFLSMWAFGTFFFDAFPSYCYIWAYGEKMTGKSTLIETLAYLSFYGSFCTDIRPAPIFREVDSTGCTLCLDEQENLLVYNTNGPVDSDVKEILALLNSGYKQGILVTRADTSGKDGISLKKFRTYSPKTFASVNPIEDTLKSRCAMINMIKMKDKRNILKPFVSEMIQYRDQMYIMRLAFASQIFVGYRNWFSTTNIFKEYGLKDRDAELFGPIVYLTMMFCKIWITPVLKFIERMMDARKMTNVATIETYIMEACRKFMNTPSNSKKDEEWIKVTDIKIFLKGSEYSDETAQKIASVLERLGFNDKDIRGGGYAYRKITRKKIDSYFKTHIGLNALGKDIIPEKKHDDEEKTSKK